ncbi:hypothetical protein FS749_003682 [Ceratobasidium sp. UAMH 11750]|nr:hypothetical protein FS749_003682 [Ceratobasidium sp. UAMH 11750]
MIPSSKRVANSRATSKIPNKDRAEIDEYFKFNLAPGLAALQPLATLTTSTDILDYAFVSVISGWPLLECLEIVIIPNESYLFPELADSAFPSLKHLALYWIPDSSTLNMFWSIPALVGKLRSAKLLPLAGFFPLDDDLVVDLQPLAILAERSPDIHDFWLRALDADARECLVLEAHISALDILNKLPLRALHLEGLHLAEWDNVTELLSTTFPALKELGMPSHEIELTELREFQTKMPQLQTLRIGVVPGDLFSGLDIDLREIKRHRRSPFRTLEVNFLAQDQYLEKQETIDSFSYQEAMTFTR